MINFIFHLLVIFYPAGSSPLAEIYALPMEPRWWPPSVGEALAAFEANHCGTSDRCWVISKIWEYREWERKQWEPATVKWEVLSFDKSICTFYTIFGCMLL